jgi:hypothetical protein
MEGAQEGAKGRGVGLRTGSETVVNWSVSDDVRMARSASKSWMTTTNTADRLR